MAIGTVGALVLLDGKNEPEQIFNQLAKLNGALGNQFEATHGTR